MCLGCGGIATDSRDTDRSFPELALDDALIELAHAWNVLTVYTDLHGQDAHASPEALRAVLTALGALAPDEAPTDALARAHASARTAPLSGPAVAWLGDHESAPTVVLRHPADAVPEARLRLESGEVRPVDLHHAHVEPFDVDGTPWHARHLRLHDLPWGHHRLELGPADAPVAHTPVIAAPVHAFAGEHHRTWGLFLPHHALHDAHTRGLGDLSALGRLGRWAASHGASMLGTLPLLPTFLGGEAQPYEPSPYAPVSRRFFGEHLLDPTVTREWPFCAEARERLAAARADGSLDALRDGNHVDPAGAWSLHHDLLVALARTAWDTPETRAALTAWADADPARQAYAWFRAQTARRGAWPTWPEELRDAHSQPAGTFSPYGPDDPMIVWLYAQHETERQLLALRDDLQAHGVELYLDLPIGTHPDGFDTWWYPQDFLGGVSAGAPPDPYFPSGQDWGFPPMHPVAWKPEPAASLLAAIEAHTTVAHRLRLDHVMGVYRLYVVPRGLGAKQGLYVRYADAPQWAALVLASHRNGCALVGENLGMVPDAIRHAMDHHRVGGMAVGQFSLRPERDDPLHPPSPGDLVCLNTHDTPTFAGWWEGEDLRAHVELGWMDPARATHERLWRARLAAAAAGFAEEGPLCWPEVELAHATAAGLYPHLCRTEADVVLVNVEDLWGETRAHNVPGTWRERPNWLRRCARPLEAFDDDHVRATLGALATERPRPRGTA